MSALLVLLMVLALSLLITRLAIAALMLTGVSQQLARLQALSALTGVGFTTTESERIVDHPVRRRVLILMMIVGNAGFVTEASTLILSFVGVSTKSEGMLRGTWLLGGIGALWLFANSEWIERHMLGLMALALRRWTVDIASERSTLMRATGWKAGGWESSICSTRESPYSASTAPTGRM